MTGRPQLRPRLRPQLRPRVDARHAIHAALCAVMAWLSAVLALPGETFGTSMSYRLMAAMGTEEQWAAVFAVVAVAGMAGLAPWPRPLLRLFCVLLLATAHGVVALCFAGANPATTATGTYGVLAGLGYYLAWRRCDEGF